MTFAIVFGLYLLVMAAIGLHCSRFNRDLSDFVLAGRRLGPWVAAFSAQASDFSAWLLIGLPAMAFATGFSQVWTCVGCALGVMFNWMVLAPRMRRMAEKYDALTIPDLLEARFADGTRLIRILSVVTILMFYAVYISAQFDAAGKVFGTAFAGRVPWGVTETWTYYRQGLIIGMVVILAYTTVGGFWAVCWTDFVQALLMVLVLIALPVLGVIHLGGFGALWSAMAANAADDAILSIHNGTAGRSFWFGVVLAGLAWGVGYPGQPHIMARFMAIESTRKIPKSALVAVTWTLFALYGSMFVGLVARGVLGADLTGPDKDQAMPMLALTLLPEVFAALALSAAVAAMMSTVDSQLIVAVAAVVRDIYEKLLGGHPSDRKAVWLSRTVVIVLGIAGVSMAWTRGDVFAGVLDAWSGLAAGLGPAIILACLWSGTSRAGVIVGMIAGVVLTQFWKQVMELFERAGDAWASWVPHLNSIELVVCVGVNLALTIAVSLAWPPRVEAEGRERR